MKLVVNNLANLIRSSLVKKFGYKNVPWGTNGFYSAKNYILMSNQDNYFQKKIKYIFTGGSE